MKQTALWIAVIVVIALLSWGGYQFAWLAENVPHFGVARDGRNG